MKITIIGAGINGLVAANYLQRHGHQVSMLELKSKVGGAAVSKSFYYQGKKYSYPTGASILGLMQDFVLQDTGLKDALSLHAPKHPEIVEFEGQKEPCFIFENVEQLKCELATKWNEQGKVKEFFSDLDLVVTFLRKGYREARVPDVKQAIESLGEEMVKRWITGTAQDLLNDYFTADATKVFFGISVTESGPVLLNTPYSAFTIPIMFSGSVFNGKWGYVKGGIWQVTKTLGSINRKLGVKITTSAAVNQVSPARMQVYYTHAGQRKSLSWDRIIFATDPLSAARILGDQHLLATVSQKQLIGSSGKLIMAFKKPVEWLSSTGISDADLALRYIVSIPTLAAMDQSSLAMKKKSWDFAPAYFEIYCEGAGQRKFGGKMNYDLVSVFFKDLSFEKRGNELLKVKNAVKNLILSRIRNKADLIKTILLTPKDLSELFHFPQGNIDHIELTEGQTFFGRTYSPKPDQSFYQFGENSNIYYCAAGAYPCGSIAGTAGYMCAQQILSTSK